MSLTEGMEGEPKKLRSFIDWLMVQCPNSIILYGLSRRRAMIPCFTLCESQVNRAQLRGCTIKYKDRSKGFGLVSSSILPCSLNESVLLVVPLDLAITPMRVLQDPLIGPACRAMFEEGEVDDRFLIIMFLLLERLRKNSTWKPYLDMLSLSFENPLWYSAEELLELQGTTLYRATELQKQQLLSLFHNKVEGLVSKILAKDGYSECAVCFEDFLWANSVFWARAMNIPLPRSYVFPKFSDEETDCNERETNQKRVNDDSMMLRSGGLVEFESATLTLDDNVWVEGIIPGIDFCNHDIKALATWEIDRTGIITGVPSSMYIRSAEEESFQMNQEISISYGTKGNEELLYLYGFVVDNNPDDYLMIHYPVEALKNSCLSETKMLLLEVQKAELRHLLYKSSLQHGFTSIDTEPLEIEGQYCSIKNSSSRRKLQSYPNKLVFPEGLLITLRTIAMQEHELQQVCSSLEQVVGCETRQPTDDEVREAVWETCGDSAALQLLVDLLKKKLIDLEEGSGSEECDMKLLDEYQMLMNISNECDDSQLKTKNWRRWCCIVYRLGQKQLSKLFLREAEYALNICLSEGV